MRERFTDRARYAIDRAMEDAGATGARQVGASHLVIGLISDPESVAATVLLHIGIDVDDIRREVRNVVGPPLQTAGGDPPLSNECEAVLELSGREAVQLGADYVDTGHILLGLVREGRCAAARVLAEHGVDRLRLIQAIREAAVTEVPDLADALVAGVNIRDLPVDSPLHLFGRSLNESPVYTSGRDREIGEIIEVLCSRPPNSVILTGPSGVGKTTIIGGFVDRLIRNKVPQPLQNHMVYELDVTMLLADLHDRAELDGRLNDIRTGLLGLNNVLLVVDNLNLLTKSTPVDVGELMATVTSAGRIRAITVMSRPRFRQLLDAEVLSDRIYQDIDVAEPDADAAAAMLRASERDTLELHYRVLITDAALAAAVTLAKESITGRALPGSAIGLVDKAASRMLSRRLGDPAKTTHDVERAALAGELTNALNSFDFRRAAVARERLKAFDRDWIQRQKQWRIQDFDTLDRVDEADILRLRKAPPGTPATPHQRTGNASASPQLPDEKKSVAILMGASKFIDPLLPDADALANNLLDLRRTLTGTTGLFLPANVHDFHEVSHADLRAVEELAQSALDTLIIYYAGHGIVDKDGYYLAYADTLSERPVSSALSYDIIRTIVTNSPATRRIVILDCCFSGNAVDYVQQGGRDSIAAISITGTLLLTATNENQPALVLPGERNSVFTGSLLRLLREGVDNGSEFIRVDELYKHIDADLFYGGQPRPRQKPTDRIGDLAFARNPYWIKANQEPAD